MEIDQLKAFLAVASTRGFHKAAQALRLTQPAISARIKTLETSLGTELFIRSRKGMAMTAAGKLFRPHAEKVLHEVALAQQAIGDLTSNATGALQIAGALSICTYFLPDVLKLFQERHRKIMINLRSGYSKQVLAMVLGGEADVGLARSLQHPEVTTISLRDDPLVLVGSPDRTPPLLRRVRLPEMVDWPLIFFERGSSDWTLTQGLFRRSGLVPNSIAEVDAIETAKRMVERGLGYAFLPHMAVSLDLRNRSLVAIEITGEEPLHRSLDLIHARSRPLSNEGRAFLEIVQEVVAGMALHQDQTSRSKAGRS